MTTEPAAQAYSRRAADYIAAVGRIEHAAQADRDYLLAWARSVEGRVVDVGCGPGQWTNYFHEAGIDVEGVDPSAVFIGQAERDYPTARFRTGWAEDLGLADASVGGILAWFSLIHHAPEAIDAPLREFARCLAPGGTVALGFFDGAAGEPFDHAITTAYYWSVDALTDRLQRVGFDVTDSSTRHDPGVRPQGRIVAAVRSRR